MSQKVPPDSSQKGFAVGRGLLAAAETLNFSMNEPRSESHQHGSTSRPLQGLGPGLGSSESDREPQQSRHGGSHIGNSMKLFASLGLSPADLDVLAQIPEDNISVETLPQLIMQLKNRKVEADRRMAGNPRGDLSVLSSEPSYRAGRDDWDEMRLGRLGGSMGQASARAQQGELGYGSMQDVPARGYDLDYGHDNSGGGGGRDPGRCSDLSHNRYGGMGMGTSLAADNVFMTRRMGSPSQGKVQDFLGVMPHMFPHVCSLCDFDVHSTMEWNQHTNGLRHAENRRLLLQMYPEWDPQMGPGRNSGSLLLDANLRSDGLLGPVPMGGGHHSGGGRMNSGWGGGLRSNVGAGKGLQHSMGGTPIRSRVVVAKYDKAPLSNKCLFDLAHPFGTLCEHLVLKNKAFLEMETHKEAKDMVNHYQQNPTQLYGKKISFYLSKELLVIEKHRRNDRGNREQRQGNEPAVASQVVFFSNLPRDNEKKKELLTIAQRFGTVEKHLFLNEEAFVQLESAEDAEMLVKYYTLNPLTINCKKIRLNICVKYKTLNVNNLSRPDDKRRRRRRSSSTGPRDKTSKSTKSSSGKEDDDDDKKEQRKGEDDGAGREGEGSSDEVAGVMEADEAGEGEKAPSEGAAEATTEEADASAGSLEEKEAAPESDDVPSIDAVPSSGDVPEKDGEGAAPVPEEMAEGAAQRERAETEGATDEPETMGKDDTLSGEPNESYEMTDEQEEGSMEQDFPENMDDFVTLDELADDEDFERQDSSNGRDSGCADKRGGRRVVNVGGFKRSYGFLNEILALAKPFGTVVQHLVLDLRREAFLQLSSEEEAKAMVEFYNGNVTPTVCGKPVKIYHSQRYTTIQSGRVVYVGQIPHIKFLDASLLKIAEPFGTVKRYFLHRSRNECFIEMENPEDAEKMAKAYKDAPPKFHGKRLTVYLSRKYKQLKYGHRPPSPDSDKGLRPSKRERSEDETSAHGSSAAKSSTKQDEEPPVKKSKEDAADKHEESVDLSDSEMKGEGEGQDDPESSTEQKADVNMDIKMEDNETSISIVSVRSMEENGQTASTPAPAEGKTSPGSLTLEHFDPNTPVGVEFVKMGYYCRVCFLFYSNEETAKKVHCSSQAHYEKLKKHLEKEKAKAQSTAEKKISV
ncbi:matrin 3-like 1.2 [Esox lucius]|uniref:Matrin 3-like 1.1 n=1 Tax=Esox lucius TaxID=8010 RepID=A0A3P8Z275_ESOLU|nr:matrin 3-like 1.2 [Esox lucius]